MVPFIRSGEAVAVKTAFALFATLAAGTLALSPAFAQTTGTAVPLTSRTMVSQAYDPFFSPAPVAAADAAAMPSASPQAGAMAPPPSDATAAHDPAGRLIAYSSTHVDGPYIAITFDDGPNPETTPKLLKILKQRGIHATFFVLGSRAAQSPDLLREMAQEGHEIGNHSWSHPQLPKIPLAEADKQIASTSDAIEKATGKRPIYLRPPYGEMNNKLREHLHQKFGLTFIYWSVDTLDWKNRDAQKIYDRAMKEVGRGGIILAHDIHATTVAAMPKLLDALIAKGYKFVTISELIAMDKPVEKVAALSPAPPKKPKPASASKPAAAKPPKPAAKPVSMRSSAPASTSNRKTTSTGLY